MRNWLLAIGMLSCTMPGWAADPVPPTTGPAAETASAAALSSPTAALSSPTAALPSPTDAGLPGPDSSVQPEGTFRIQDYRIADYHELGLSLNGNGSYSDTDQAYWDPLGVDHRQLNQPSANLYLQPKLQGIGVTQSRDSSYLWPLTLSGFQNDSYEDHNVLSGTLTEHTDSTSQTSGGEAQLSPNGSFTWYRGGWQAGVIGNLNLSAQQTLTQNDTVYYDTPYGGPTAQYDYSNVNDTETYSASGHLEARVGLGRTVEGRWAWNAIQLARDLAAVGSLLKPMAPEDLQALAGLLAAVGQALPWDFRAKKLHDTEILCAFLQEHGYIRADDVKAVDTVSDVYLDGSLSRRFGGYAVALAELQGGLSHSGVTGHQVNNGAYFNTVNFDAQQDYVSQPAPGAGLEAAYYLPLDAEWQCNLYGRFDYWPFVRQEAVHSTNDSREALASLNASLDYAPSTRVTVTLGDQVTGQSMRVETQDQDPAPWTPLSTYDDLYFSNTASLTYACQLTYYVVASVTGGISYIDEIRNNPWARTLSKGPATDAFESQYDQPLNSEWQPSVNFNLTYRFL